MASRSVCQDQEIFDEVTRVKLNIYSGYLREWLRAPLSGRMRVEEVAIHDLLCGPGSTTDGQKGSPLRAIDVIRASEGMILGNPGVSVRLVFNDRSRQNVESLRRKIGHHICCDGGLHLANVDYFARPFAELLEELVPRLQVSQTANLLFLDRFDTSVLDESRFRLLHALKKTDVVFFLASNWFRQFTETSEAERWGFSKSHLEDFDYNHIHRFMAAYFRHFIGGDYYIAPFSLTSGTDLHGLVFASHDPQALERFLKVAWEIDPYTGRASFDLYDNDVSPSQLALLDARKVSKFQSELMASLERGKFRSDREIYMFMLQRGFLARHATDTITAFCRRLDVKFRDKTGKLCGPRLSSASFRQPRQMLYN